MNVLLLYPEFPNGFWSFKYALKFIGCRAALPPLGLVTVAAMLPTAWNLRLVDMNVEKLRDQDLRWADYVLLGAMIVHTPERQMHTSGTARRPQRLPQRRTQRSHTSPPTGAPTRNRAERSFSLNPCTLYCAPGQQRK